MEFVAQLMANEPDPRAWLAERQQEGWHGVSLGDHLFPAETAYPHLWVTIGQWSAASSAMRLAASFANNLIRSPVEFAHAALTAQACSGGRFEAGLGAGWSKADVGQCGLPYAEPAARARRYREAAIVVRTLLQDRSCVYHGEFYDIEVTSLGVLVDDPPPLVVGVGGPWTIEHVAPLGDRVEVVSFANAIRGGHFDFRAFRRPPRVSTTDAVERVWSVNPGVPIQLGVFVAAGSGTAVDRCVAAFDGGPLEGLAGEPARVADTLKRFVDLGISRCSVNELTPYSYRRLAPHLLV